MSGLQQISQTPGYRPPEDQKRTLSIKNMSGEEIPGFAACILKRWVGENSERAYYAQEAIGGDVVWHVYKPDDDAAGLQDAAMIIINGPTPIPKGGIGVGSQDWPLQALHGGKTDPLPNGSVCGLISGRWYLRRTEEAATGGSGSAFFCLSHDDAATSGEPGTHTIWVAPNHNTPLPSAFALTASGSALRGDAIPMSVAFADDGHSIAGFTSLQPLATATCPTEVDTSGQVTLWRAVRIPISGYYLVGMSASIESSGTSGNDTLGLRVQTRDEATCVWSDTYLRCQREENTAFHTTYSDTYTDTFENIAVAGPLKLEQGAYVRAVATGNGPGMNYSLFVLSFMRLGGIPTAISGIEVLRG